MNRTLSKEQLADFAQQAVSSIRRFMSSTQDIMTLTQQDLISTSKTIEESWRKRHVVACIAVVELWATSFQAELLSQLDRGNITPPHTTTATINSNKDNDDIHVTYNDNDNGNDISLTESSSTKKNVHRTFLGESSMLICTEVLRILLRSNGEKAAEIFTRYHLVTHMADYLIRVPMGKRMRDTFAADFLEIAGYNLLLLEEALSVSHGLLVIPEDSKSDIVVAPQQIQLACLLTAAFRRVDVNNVPAESARIECGQSGFLSGLIRTCSLILKRFAEGISEGTQLTALVTYFGLINGMMRGCAANKTLCEREHREELMTLWVVVASHISKIELSLPIPTNVPGKDAIFSLEGTQVWTSELIEFLVEVTTCDSFSLKRQTLHVDSIDTDGGGSSGTSLCGNGNDNTSGWNSLSISCSTSLSPLAPYSSGTGDTSRRYEFLPARWDTFLATGSTYVWHLASILFNCVLSKEGCEFIAEALLRIDTQSALSEFIYRGVIATLMLLCVATPRNVEVVAESPIIEALIALITCSQDSVFSREVIIAEKCCTPSNALNAYPVQTTISFMSFLSSLYTSERMLPKLLRAVEEMCLRQTSLTDAYIIDSLLHALTCASLPQDVLFFSGTSSVVCMVDKFSATRFYGYSFAAWIQPKCVWIEGSHLFSFTDGSSGASVMLMIVANGRSCSLVIRTQHSTDVTISSIPDTSFSADTWSHIGFSHSLSGFALYINGRRTENSVSVPFPKAHTKKDRLQFSFGGYRGEPSFYGYIASIGLFDNSLSEKDFQRMYAAGPRPSRELSFMSCHPLLSVDSQTVPGTTLLNVGVTGGLAGRNEGVSVQSVTAFSPRSVQEMFAREGVVDWALRTIGGVQGSSANFLVIARLCARFVFAAMRLTTTEEELGRVMGEDAIGRLRELMLAWESLPIEVPAILVAGTIPRGGGKVMRTHHTTQEIISLLLDIISKPNAQPTTILCILRELSDALLLPENVAIFQAVPSRFERILALSTELPLECVESLITLVERLCKEQREMEQTLRFLLSESNSKTGDFVKAEMLRMLFDIALTNPAVCDLIGGSFGNRGISFLIELVGGRNHSDEAIRVFSLRIISLMQHTNKRFREHFMRSHGYEVLAAVMTGSSPCSSYSVPIRLATFNCLFQMAFDAIQPTRDGSTVLSYIQQGSSSKAKRRNGKHTEHNLPTVHSGGNFRALNGYVPGLLSPELKVTRREYSFDISFDFAYGNDTRNLLDDTYRCFRTRGSGFILLRVPQVIQTILSLLEHLLKNANTSSTGFLAAPGADSTVCCEGAVLDVHSLAQEERGVPTTADSLSTASVVSPTQDESVESITLRVLSHIEKIVDRPENGELLLSFPWLLWLWGAVGQVLDPSCSPNNNNNNTTNSNSNNNNNNGTTDSFAKISKKTTVAIQRRVRNIIHSLAFFDLSCNTKAGIVRTLRQTEQSPFLIRLILEDIVSHFRKNRCEITNRNDAVNIIKNLDLLFHDIEEVLHPLPLTLGLEIVNSISAIAVNNNSWVRTKMKNSSRLFETRKHLSFLLLKSTKRFSKLEPATLDQLLRANAQEQNTIRFLFYRLINATTNCDADEVEVLLTLIQQLTSGDQHNRQAVFSIIGAEYRSFAELVCGSNVCSKNTTSSSSQPQQQQDCSASLSNTQLLHSEGLPASEVIQWSREDEGRWEIVRRRVYASMKFLDNSRRRNHTDDGERSPMFKSRRVEERQQSVQHKVAAEVERISREVSYYMTAAGNGGGTSSNSSGGILARSNSSSNNFMKVTALADSTTYIQRNLPF